MICGRRRLEKSRIGGIFPVRGGRGGALRFHHVDLQHPDKYFASATVGSLLKNRNTAILAVLGCGRLDRNLRSGRDGRCTTPARRPCSKTVFQQALRARSVCGAGNGGSGSSAEDDTFPFGRPVGKRSPLNLWRIELPCAGVCANETAAGRCPPLHHDDTTDPTCGLRRLSFEAGATRPRSGLERVTETA